MAKGRKLRHKSYKKRAIGLYSRYGRNPELMSSLHRGALPHTSVEKALRDIATSRSQTTWVINYGNSRGSVNRNTI